LRCPNASVYYVVLNGKKKENGIYHLANLFLSSLVDRNSRIDAGCNPSDKRVEKIVGAIIDSQLEDGGGQPFWMEKSDSVYTVLTLKLLASLNMVNVRDPKASMLIVFGKWIAYVKQKGLL